MFDLSLSYVLYALVLVIGCALHLRNRNQSYLKQVVGFKSWPLIGNMNYIKLRSKHPDIPTLSHFQDLSAGLALVFQKEGLHRFRIGTQDFVFITSPEHAEVVTSSKTELHKGPIYEGVKSYFGDGLVTSNGGDKWKMQRKLLNSCFTAKVLNEHYFPVMIKQAVFLSEKLKSFVGKDYAEITTLLEMYVLDVFMDAGMAVYTNFHELQDCSYQSTLKLILNTWVERPLRPWLINDAIFNLTNWGKQFKSHVETNLSFVQKIIKEKQQQYKTGAKAQNIAEAKKTDKKAFLDLVLAEQNSNKTSFSDQDILNEVTTFVAAGYDNTSTSISWIMYMIGLHPEVQDKIQAELDTIFADDPKRTITTADLIQMRYLECTIKETMRLYPGIPIIARKLQGTMKIDGKSFPKGTNLLIHIWALHRHPDYFTNPEEFNPDRNFSDKAFMAFSLGPRNCIGQKFALMEQKVMVASILRELRIQSLQPRDKVLYVPRVVGRPNREIQLMISNRQQQNY